MDSKYAEIVAGIDWNNPPTDEEFLLKLMSGHLDALAMFGAQSIEITDDIINRYFIRNCKENIASVRNTLRQLYEKTYPEDFEPNPMWMSLNLLIIALKKFATPAGMVLVTELVQFDSYERLLQRYKISLKIDRDYKMEIGQDVPDTDDIVELTRAIFNDDTLLEEYYKYFKDKTPYEAYDKYCRDFPQSRELFLHKYTIAIRAEMAIAHALRTIRRERLIKDLKEENATLSQRLLRVLEQTLEERRAENQQLARELNSGCSKYFYKIFE